jgi:tetratricopeptide (TPR) repeat protein
LGGGLLVLIVLLAYLPALKGGFVWDDDSWTIKLVRVLRDTSGLRSIWLEPKTMQQYYPLSGTAFWLDYQLWGFWPLPYHVEDVLLHALAALLFWRSLRSLRVPGAGMACAIFALHPMMVESAAWIAERKNVLSLCLCLGSYLAFQRYRRSADLSWSGERQMLDANPPRGTSRDALFYLLALLMFVAAMAAKTAVCAMPAATLLLIWFRRGALRWREDVAPTIPFFAVALAMGAVTAWLEKTHVGAQGADYALTVWQRGLIAGRAFWFYLGKLLWPANLCFVYPRWQPDATDWRQWLYPATALGLLFTLWQKRIRLGRGPVTALLFFTGTLAPLLGFVNVYFMRYSFVCDHWVYLPSLGPIALASAGMSRLLERLGQRPSVKFALGGVLLLTLFALTSQRTPMYADLETLWRTTIDENPVSWVAHNNLGNALFRRARTEEAVSHFQRAIELKPDLAEAYTSLGVAQGSAGHIDQAIANFKQAIRVAPDYAEAYYDLGIALNRTGQTDEAIRQFQEAIRLKPGFSAAKSSLHSTLARRRHDGSAPLNQSL